MSNFAHKGDKEKNSKLKMKLSALNIKIDSNLVDKLAEYQKITGVSINRCMEEAISEWLECVAPVRIEAISQSDIPKVAVNGGVVVWPHR